MRLRKDSGDRIVMFLMGLAACCALTLIGCSGSSDSADSTELIDSPSAGDAAAPVVILRPDGWEPPMPTEAAVLADRLLRREDDRLLLDAVELSQLAGEIASVLSSIRDAYPAVGDVTVRMPYAYGELILGLEPLLYDSVASLLDDQTGPVALETGYPQFDSLNNKLGLSVVVDLFSFSRAATFYFSEFLNVPAAAAAYEMVEGIEHAESNAYVGDGPDVDAVNSQGRWFVVLRSAEGDCPAGCIYEELFFFIVDGAAVEMIDRDQALERAEFMNLVMDRSW